MPQSQKTTALRPGFKPIPDNVWTGAILRRSPRLAHFSESAAFCHAPIWHGIFAESALECGHFRLQISTHKNRFFVRLPRATLMTFLEAGYPHPASAARTRRLQPVVHLLLLLIQTYEIEVVILHGPSCCAKQGVRLWRQFLMRLY